MNVIGEFVSEAIDKSIALVMSRRFWAAVATIIGILASSQSPQEKIQQIAMVVSAWIVSDGIQKTERPGVPLGNHGTRRTTT